jgi:hypothetical protein
MTRLIFEAFMVRLFVCTQFAAFSFVIVCLFLDTAICECSLKDISALILLEWTVKGAFATFESIVVQNQYAHNNQAFCILQMKHTASRRTIAVHCDWCKSRQVGV